MHRDKGLTEGSLKVNPLTLELWQKILKLHESNGERFGAYNLTHPSKTIFSGAVLREDEVIGLGSVPLLAEAVLVVDPNQSVRTRLRSIELLLNQFKIGVRDLDGLHAFIQDPEFSNILQRHFGFRKCKGEALYLEL